MTRAGLAVAYHRRAVRSWWLLDRHTNRFLSWVGRRTSAAYDRLTRAEARVRR